MAAELLDAVGKLLGVADFAPHIGAQRLLDLFGPHAVEIRAVGQIIHHGLEFHAVALQQEVDDFLLADGHEWLLTKVGEEVATESCNTTFILRAT